MTVLFAGESITTAIGVAELDGVELGEALGVELGEAAAVEVGDADGEALAAGGVAEGLPELVGDAAGG